MKQLHLFIFVSILFLSLMGCKKAEKPSVIESARALTASTITPSNPAVTTSLPEVTETPAPYTLLTPAPTPDWRPPEKRLPAVIDSITVSSEGQLGLRHHGDLYVEQPIGSGQLTLIQTDVAPGIYWSPDGTKILYGIQTADQYYPSITQYALWDRTTEDTTLLTDLITAIFPAFPPHPFWWDNDVILFSVHTDVYAANLKEKSFTHILSLSGQQSVRVAGRLSDGFYTRQSSGSRQTVRMGYNLQGQPLWPEAIPNYNNTAINPATQTYLSQQRQTIYEIPISTGQVAVLWQGTETSRLVDYPLWQSPDGNYFSLHVATTVEPYGPGWLQVYRKDGMRLGSWENGLLLSWHSDGALIITPTADARQQLILFDPETRASTPLDATYQQFDYRAIPSSDSQHVLYAVRRLSYGDHPHYLELRLWSAGAEKPLTIHTSTTAERYVDVVWDEVNGRFFFNDNWQPTLWQYDRMSGDLSEIYSFDN